MVIIWVIIEATISVHAMNHTQLCFMLTGPCKADMWYRSVVVLFGEQLFSVGLVGL